MAKSKLETGPVGERVAANLTALRVSRGLNQGQLAARMTDIGRPMSGAVVSKTEKLDRRIDADDLVAFAIALGATPNRLLLAALTGTHDKIDLAPGATRVPAREAWAWATGETPLPIVNDLWRPNDPSAGEDSWQEELHQFQRDNNPYSGTEETHIAEAMREIDNHPDIFNQAIKLIKMAKDGGVCDIDFLFAAIDIAKFYVENMTEGRME